MKSTNSSVNLTGKTMTSRFRSLLLVMPMLLAAYALAGLASPALAQGGNDRRGTVDVTAGSGTVGLESQVTFTITAHNGSQAGPVTVYNTLPRHTHLVFASGCTSESNGNLSCSFTMFPDSVASAVVVVALDSDAGCGTRLTDTAHVIGWQPSRSEVVVDCQTP